MSAKDTEELDREIRSLVAILRKHGLKVSETTDGSESGKGDLYTAAREIQAHTDQKVEEAKIEVLDSLTFKELDVSDVEKFEYQNDGSPMLVIEPSDINRIIAQLRRSES